MFDEFEELTDRDEARMAIGVMMVALACFAYLAFQVYQKAFSVSVQSPPEIEREMPSSSERYSAISAGFSGK